MRLQLLGRAEFLLVYIREAHAADEWRMESNDNRGITVFQPTNFDDRTSAARGCTGDLMISMPAVVDGMDDAVAKAYGAWPDRIYVIDAQGRIAYQGGVGPFGFKPGEVREVLRDQFGL